MSPSAKARGSWPGRSRPNCAPLAGVLGIAQVAPEQWAAPLRTPEVDPAPNRPRQSRPASRTAAIDALIVRRLDARKNKDFKEADRIRDELAAQGVILEDRPGGPDGMAPGIRGGKLTGRDTLRIIPAPVARVLKV